MKPFFVKFALLVALFTSPAAFSESTTFETSNTPIADFVAWGARELNQPIVLGAGVVGTVSFTAPSLEPSEYPAFFNNVLSAHGYWVEFENGLYVVKPLDNAVQNLEPSHVKLYRLTHVRNTKVNDLIHSLLTATNEQVVNNAPTQSFSVEILPTTNGLIVSGTQDQLDKIDLLISGIDSPQRQVFIEAIITESEIGDNQEVGVNLEVALDKAGFISQPTAIDKLVDSHLILEGGNFTALVKAVSSSENTNLLSRPNILIMDREVGYITVGQNVPFLTATEVTDGGNTIQQIERKDVGVSLEVVPHVMGDHVVLEITQESSSVTNSAIATDIITNKRTLKTVVKVRDNQTIALGGLISDEERDSVSGVPLLMDIPLLGALFRSEGTSTIQKELKVVIRTTIL